MRAFAEPGPAASSYLRLAASRDFSGASLKTLLIGFALGIICLVAFLAYSAGNL